MDNLKKNKLYEHALKGKHPDLKNKKTWTRHPSESINRALNLSLRDVFTPICSQFYEKILQIDPKIIQEIAEKVKVHKTVYHDMIFEKNTSPFVEGYVAVSALVNIEQRRKNLHFQEWETHYSELNNAEQKYYVQLLAHTKKVAPLERYGLSEMVSGNYHHFLWSPIDDYSPTISQAVDTTVVPVGEYGENFAKKMLLTTNILAKLFDKFFEDIAKEVEKKNWDLVINETARGREKQKAIQQEKSFCHWDEEPLSDKKTKHIYDVYHENRTLSKKESSRISVQDSFKEGLQSVQAALSSLLPEKVANLEENEILAKVINSGLAVQFAKIVPFGYTLPVIRRGKFFKNIIGYYSQQAEKKTLLFNPDFCDKARKLKQDYLKTRVYENDKRNPGFLGFGCPAAIKNKEFKQTAIRYILDAYQYIFAKQENILK